MKKPLLRVFFIKYFYSRSLMNIMNDSDFSKFYATYTLSIGIADVRGPNKEKDATLNVN